MTNEENKRNFISKFLLISLRSRFQSILTKWPKGIKTRSTSISIQMLLSYNRSLILCISFTKNIWLNRRAQHQKPVNHLIVERRKWSNHERKITLRETGLLDTSQIKILIMKVIKHCLLQCKLLKLRFQ